MVSECMGLPFPRAPLNPFQRLAQLRGLRRTGLDTARAMLWNLRVLHPSVICCTPNDHLVGGWATPLKNMSSSIWMMNATQ